VFDAVLSAEGLGSRGIDIDTRDHADSVDCRKALRVLASH
jgi:hypothetical protein